MVGFDSASRPDALWRPETWGWMGGFAAVGLIMIGYGIYRGLSRLGDDDGDSPS